MINRYIKGIIFFIVAVISLPFIIEGLYVFGEKHPLIILRYTQNEMLTYLITVSGLLISMWALFLAKSAGETHFKITYTMTTVNSNTYFNFKVINDSLFDYLVNDFGFVDKKRSNLVNINSGLQFIVAAKDSNLFQRELNPFVEKFNKAFKHKNKYRKIYYFLKLATGEEIYINANDFIKAVGSIN